MNKRIIIISIIFIIIAIAVMYGVINLNNSNAPKCVVAGCSGELCVDENDPNATKVSICIWTDKMSCYKKSVCELQSNGVCGWSENEEFNACLNSTDNTTNLIGY
jgi:hypothetical protein